MGLIILDCSVHKCSCDSLGSSLNYEIICFLFQLPPSIQTVLEQEPLGLTPQMTVLVTIVTIVMATLISCITFAFGVSRKNKSYMLTTILRHISEAYALQIFTVINKTAHYTYILQYMNRSV